MGFRVTGHLDAPPLVLLSALQEMNRRHKDIKKQDSITEHMKLLDDTPAYRKPPVDRLYRSDFEHRGNPGTCEDCDATALVERLSRKNTRQVEVHYGIIASANTVMKNATERDRYATDPEIGALCFEIEAAGLMNHFRCLIIRGISDYSDSHKNDDWRRYSALTAAAYARELLLVISPRRVSVAPSWVGELEGSK